MLKILITNDDGVAAPGIVALAQRLALHAAVVVVAPEKPSSARSHCITLHKPLRLNQLPAYDTEACRGSLEVHACSGTPVDCIVLGLDHVCSTQRPDLIISGINDGYNVAEDLIYSGTVGGAVEGAINGIPSLAISQGRFDGMDFAASSAVIDLLIGMLLYGSCFEWQQATYADMLAHRDTQTDGIFDLTAVRPDSTADCFPTPGDWFPGELHTVPCLNLNLPGIPVSQTHGLCWAVAGKRDYVDVVQKRDDPFGRQYFWIAGERVLQDELTGSDTWALSRGLISATPMLFDMTSRADMQAFRGLPVNRGTDPES